MILIVDFNMREPDGRIPALLPAGIASRSLAPGETVIATDGEGIECGQWSARFPLTAATPCWKQLVERGGVLPSVPQQATCLPVGRPSATKRTRSLRFTETKNVGRAISGPCGACSPEASAADHLKRVCLGDDLHPGMAGKDRGDESPAAVPPAGGLAAYFEILALVARSLLDEALNLDERLRLTLRLATEALGADRGSIMIANQASKELRIRASLGLPPEASNSAIRFGEGIAGWVAANNQPLVLHGDFEDSRFKGSDPSIESSLSLPLAVQERVLGVLNIVRKSGGRFTEDDLRLASSLADLAALAIEKAQLYSALKEREKRVTNLLAAAISAQEQERRRIAADIHDGFLQNLSALFLKAEKVKVQLDQGQLEEASSAIKEIQNVVVSEMGAMRDYIFEIRPPSLDQVGLEPTLREMVDRVTSEHLIAGEFHQTGKGERLPEAVEAIFYRTAQEALRNIVKHSGAKTFTVSLEKTDQEASLRIRDDGTGIEKKMDWMPRRGHYGIDTMRERVELAGGRFRIGRRRGGGTEVKVVIPLG